MKKRDKVYWCFAVVVWLLILLTGCKTASPSCDAYGSTKEKRCVPCRDLLIITNDTLYLAEEYVHLDEDRACEWSPAYIYIIRDTVRVLR